jgi:hypothetical protein
MYFLLQSSILRIRYKRECQYYLLFKLLFSCFSKKLQFLSEVDEPELLESESEWESDSKEAIFETLFLDTLSLSDFSSSITF